MINSHLLYRLSYHGIFGKGADCSERVAASQAHGRPRGLRAAAANYCMDITPAELPSLAWDHALLELPGLPWSAVAATAIPAPMLALFNPDAATLLDLSPTCAGTTALAEAMAGNRPLPGAQPVATAYGGHQFGIWAGRLGDGRAILLGAVRNSRGERWEVQLKGAGPTPYSRGADGRAVLRSTLREYLCSEAMHALGIPTTRALAVVSSPLPVRRETLETAAVLTRLAPSFIRFGHFEWLAATDQPAALKALALFIIDNHHPELSKAPDAFARWLDAVVRRTALLMAQWQAVGFCHGVMNTDNFSVLGLTLDYGPFGFIDGFDAGHICNHSDEAGRYAYEQQPQVGHWNCAQLLSACLPLLADDQDAALAQASHILDGYRETYASAALAQWRRKLGLVTEEAGDATLANRWLTLLHRTHADFTLSFRRLATVRAADTAPDAGRDHLADPLGYDAWIADYRARLQREGSDDAERRRRMNTVNPLYVLRNHLAQRAIERAESGDFSEAETLARVLRQPFIEQADAEHYAQPPPPGLATVAVSCSS